MALQKCPRCELNYIREDEQYCNVCRRGMNLKAEKEEPEQNLCIECSENTAMKGQDLCAYCLAEKRRREKLEKLMEKPAPLIIDMDEMDQIDDTDETDIPTEELKDLREEFGDEEEEDLDEEESFLFEGDADTLIDEEDDSLIDEDDDFAYDENLDYGDEDEAEEY
ncbi:hypothetical protein LJC07_00080 [Christensenellaceae bacterium OttesenSCG-928-L17]|nr:hypothetical protein [Christensenellaceae bacterium OttesenSCG-928-L17]